MTSRRTKISPKNGRGLGHVTPTIFGSTVGYPSDSLASCYIFVPSDLDLWLFDLKFDLPVTLIRSGVSRLNLKFLHFLFFEQIKGMGQTREWRDRRTEYNAKQWQNDKLARHKFKKLFAVNWHYRYVTAADITTFQSILTRQTKHCGPPDISMQCCMRVTSSRPTLPVRG